MIFPSSYSSFHRNSLGFRHFDLRCISISSIWDALACRETSISCAEHCLSARVEDKRLRVFVRSARLQESPCKIHDTLSVAETHLDPENGGLIMNDGTLKIQKWGCGSLAQQEHLQRHLTTEGTEDMGKWGLEGPETTAVPKMWNKNMQKNTCEVVPQFVS